MWVGTKKPVLQGGTHAQGTPRLSGLRRVWWVCIHRTTLEQSFRRPLNYDLQCAMNLGPKGLRRHKDAMSVCCLDAVWLWCIRIHRTTGAELHICMARWLEMLVCAVR